MFCVPLRIVGGVPEVTTSTANRRAADTNLNKF